MHKVQHVRGYKTRGELAKAMGILPQTFNYKVATGGIPGPTHTLPGYTKFRFYSEEEAQQIIETYGALFAHLETNQK